MKGKLITFEGIDGCGKTTQIQLISDYLKSLNFDVVLTREPGGTQFSEQIRNIVLDSKIIIDDLTQLFLFLAARADHINKVILPSLNDGKVVLCDRFYDSTIVYQGFANRFLSISEDSLLTLVNISKQNIEPDITILIDIDPVSALQRRIIRESNDRFENKDILFQKSIRQGYLEEAKLFESRINIINGDRLKEDVYHDVLEIIKRDLIAHL